MKRDREGQGVGPTEPTSSASGAEGTEIRAAREVLPEAAREEPPVVARLVVEIRSDGSRTIARGAIEDTASGQRVAIEAKGSTPLLLAASLARELFRLPALARTAARALLQSRRRR
jgi:hypothetical protein